MNDLEDLMEIEKINFQCFNKKANLSQNYIEDILNIGKRTKNNISSDIFDTTIPNLTSRNTIDTLYTSLSSETLGKIKKNTVKSTYKDTLFFYQDFDSEDFHICQSDRSNHIIQTIDTLRTIKTVRPRMIEKLYDSPQMKKSTYVIGKISSLITLFFTKANKDILLKELGEFIQELKDKREERQTIKVIILKSIEKSFELLLLLINSTQSNEDRLEYLIEVMKCLPYIESKTVLFNLLNEFSKGDALRKEYDDKGVSFFNICKLFNFNCNKINANKETNNKREEKEAINELTQEMNKFFNQSTQDNKVIKVVNNSNLAYILVYCITKQSSDCLKEQKTDSNQEDDKHLVMIAKRISNNEIEQIKLIDSISQSNNLNKINVIIKDDSVIWIVSFTGKVIQFTILHLSTLEVFKIDTIELEEVISQVYNDKKRVYCILTQSQRLFSCKLNLNLSDQHYYSLSSEQDSEFESKSEVKSKRVNSLDYKSLCMKDSVVINDIILLENKEGYKSYSKFSLNKFNSTAIHYILHTQARSNSNKLYSHYEASNVWIKFSCNQLKIKQLSPENQFIALPYSYHCGNLINPKTAYESLIYSYAKYIQTNGNFDMINLDSIKHYNLIQHPLVIVEDSDFSFILKQIVNCDMTSPLLSSYFIIIKQYTNTLFNMNKTSSITSNRDIEKQIITLKQFIVQFIKGYPSSTCPHKKLILNQIKEIENNLSIDCIPIEELKPLIAQCKTNIAKLSLLQLLIKENNYSKMLLYQLASEIEVDLFNNNNEEYKQNYVYINSTLKYILESFEKYDFDSDAYKFLTIIYESIKSIAEKCIENSNDNTSNQLKKYMIRNSFIFKATFFFIQNMIIKQNSIEHLKDNLTIMINLLIKLQQIDNLISIDNNTKNTLYEIKLSNANKKMDHILYFNNDDLIIRHSLNCVNLQSLQLIINNEITKDSASLIYSPLLKGVKKIELVNKNEDNQYLYKAQLYSPNECIVSQNDLLNSIELSIAYYILSICQQEELNQEKNRNQSSDLDKKLMPFYCSKLLQFITLNDNDTNISNKSKDNQYIDVPSLLSSLEINSESTIQSMFLTYQSKESLIENTKKSLSSIDYSLPQVELAINNLNKALSKKSVILSTLGGIKIMPIITKLFSVIVKFHHLNSKFLIFATDINDASIDSWTTIVNYDIFYSIWAECSQIRIWFSELKSQIPESELNEDINFDNEITKQIDTLSTKAQFIHDIIFPSPYEVITYRKESVVKLIEILKSNEFGIEEIKKRSLDQNAKSAIKTNHLNLINVLLSVASKENVLNYILYHLNKHFRTEKKKLVSFVDNLLGADYLSIDKVKNQFHLMLDVIKDKITSSSFDSMSKNTKMNMYQSLIWKIKGRDFYIVNKLCSVLTSLKTFPFSLADNNDSKESNSLLTLSETTINQRLFELFKILSLQVFKRIKSTNAFQRKDSLTLSRNVSKIVEDDEKQIINYFIAFYCDLSDHNENFNAFLLHLYQCLVNERDLIILVINSSPLILVKIIKILQTNANKTTMVFQTKLVLVKLLYQLLSNVNDTTQVEPDLLLSICNIKEEDSQKDKDPYEVIFNFVFELFSIERDILLKKEYELIIQMFITNEQFASFCNEKLLSVITSGNLIQLTSLFGVDITPYRYSKRILLSNNTSELLSDIDGKNTKYGYILSFSQSNGDKDNGDDDDLCSYYAKSNKCTVNYSEEKKLELKGLSAISHINIKDLLLVDEPINDSIKEFIETNKEVIVKEAIKLLLSSSISTQEKYLLLKFFYFNLFYLKIQQSQMDELYKTLNAMMNNNFNNDFFFTSLEVLENQLLYLIERPNENILNNKIKPKAICDLLTYTIDIKLQTFILENYFNRVEYGFKMNNFNKANFNSIVTKTVSFYDNDNNQLIWNDIDSDDKDKQFLFVEYITEDFVKWINNSTNEYLPKIKCIITKNSNSDDSPFNSISLLCIILPESSYNDIVSSLLSQHTSAKEMSKLFFFNYDCFSENKDSDNNQHKLKEEEEETYNGEDENSFEALFKIQEPPKCYKIKFNREHQMELLQKTYAIKEECFKRMIVLITRRILLKSITLKHMIDIQYATYFTKTNILDICRLISFEYYLNTTYSNVSNENIKKLMKGFLESLSNDNLSIEIINIFFNSPIYSKINYFNNDISSIQSYCKLSNRPNESVMLKETKETFDMTFSILIFLLNAIFSFDKSNSNAIQFFLSSFFDKIESLSETVYEQNKSLSTFMLNIMSKIYDEIIHDKPNKGIYMEFLKDYDLSQLISVIIFHIDIDKFLNDKDNVNCASKSNTDLIQFVFKYYDVTFWMFINYNLYHNVYNWISNDLLFNQFYYQYHILSLNKTQEPHDVKLSLVQTINAFNLMDILRDINKNHNKNLIEEKKKKTEEGMTYQLKLNQSIDIELEGDNNNIIKINKQDGNNNKGDMNTKLVVFIKDNSSDNIYIQDIIDCSHQKNHKYYYQTYPSKHISLCYMNDIKTKLYAFGSNYSHSLGINGEIGIDYSTPQKCKGLSDSTWNFNYGYYYVIALDDNGSVYSCGANIGGGLNKRSIKQFSDVNEINKSEVLKNNISDFACGNSDSTLILTKDDKLYGIGRNDSNILSGRIGKKCKVPTLITQPSIQSKIVQISLGYKNAFVITENGQGFAIGSNAKNQINETKTSEFSDWIEIKLSSDLKGFVSSVCCEEFLIFLIETNEDTIELYSSGNNNEKKNNIGVIETKDSYFKKCNYSKGLQFKTISSRNLSCAATTSSGKLCLWNMENYNSKGIGLKTNYLSQIQSQKETIYDDVSISNSHVLALVRKKNGTQYTKELLSMGDNSHGTLGIVTYDNKNIFRKIPLFSNAENTPIKIVTGFDHSFALTVDTNEIQSKLNSNAIINSNVQKNQLNVTISKGKLNINNEIVSFYQSSSFAEIEEHIKQMGQNIIQEFYDLLEDIRFSKEIKIEQVTYTTFKEELSNKPHLKLRTFFSSKEVNDAISHTLFIYLSTKIQLINSAMIKFSDRNKHLDDKAFLNKAIKNNLHFLSSETRIKNFNDSLSQLRKNLKNKRIYCKIDRFKASEFYEKNIVDFELKETVFGQVYQSINKIEKEYYYLGQLERLFVVDFVREGATDQGGPYHDVFTAIADEVQSKSLDLFIKSPNNKVNIGVMRDKYVINPDAILENQINAYEFLGKLFASSIFTGECLNLNIHPAIWRLLFGTKILFSDLETIDFLFYKLINDIDKCECKTNDEFIKQFDLLFSIQNSAGKEIELKKNGAKIKVTLDNKDEFIKLAKQRRIEEFDFQKQAIKKGLNQIIDESYLEILSWRELDELICGKPKLNLELLRKRTSYSGYTEKDEIISWFWQALDEFTEQERILYLKYVWGRSRLPSESCSFTHVVSKIGYNDSSNKLPQSCTCFFKLLLPRYPTKEALIAKLKYAIVNCNEIDADY